MLLVNECSKLESVNMPVYEIGENSQSLLDHPRNFHFCFHAVIAFPFNCYVRYFYVYTCGISKI